jgi:hypothetical protein
VEAGITLIKAVLQICKISRKPASCYTGVALKRTRLISFSILLLLCSASCATPALRPSNYLQPAPPDDRGLAVDLDLLASAKLPEDKKLAGEQLLLFFHASEGSLERYIRDVQGNIEANEKLRVKYGTADAIIGGVTGMTSPAILVEPAAVAIPIAGALWIIGSQIFQQSVIDPEIERARKHLEEARQLLQLFPDTSSAFRGMVFAGSETEALRRFSQWQAYVESYKKKVDHFFSEQ